MENSGTQRSKIIYLVTIVLIGIFIHGIILFNGFVGDDTEMILNNTLMQPINNIPTLFTHIYITPGISNEISGAHYRPMMLAYFSLIKSLFGANPFFFHLPQLLFHITNSVLLFLFFTFFFRKKVAFVLALVFLVHPVNDETVAYISNLQDILFFFFGILAIVLLAKQNRDKLTSFFLAFCLLCSLLSKETAILFFIVACLYWMFFIRQKIGYYIFITLIPSCVYLFLRFTSATVNSFRIEPSPMMQLSFPERLISIPKVIFYYFQTFFYPAQLAFSQEWVIHSVTVNDFYLPLLFDLLFFLFFIGIAVYLYSYKENKEVFTKYLFFFLWFCAGMLFHMQLIPLDMTVADRWFYFPIVGLLGMIGAISILLKKPIYKKYKIPILLLVTFIICLLSIRTILRNFEWRDGLTLYSHDITISKDSARLQNNLGNELVKNGQIDAALPHFQQAVELDPKLWVAWDNIGIIYEKKGQIQKAKKYYQLAMKENFIPAYENMARVILQNDNSPMPAKTFCLQSIKKYPLDATLWLTLSLSDNQLGNHKNALSEAEHAYSLIPDEKTLYVIQSIQSTLSK